jgi:hypothetical protein
MPKAKQGLLPEAPSYGANIRKNGITPSNEATQRMKPPASQYHVRMRFFSLLAIGSISVEVSLDHLSTAI